MFTTIFVYFQRWQGHIQECILLCCSFLNIYITNDHLKPINNNNIYLLLQIPQTNITSAWYAVQDPLWFCVCIINSYITLLNWPIVNLLILFILFSYVFCILVNDNTLCFIGSHYRSVNYYNYISVWPYHIGIHYGDRKLSKSKATGLDMISMKLLKLSSCTASQHLTGICNLSIQTGIFPDNWKIARVVLIFKSGNTSDFGNYRPISVLPICSKILERHVHDYYYLTCHHRLLDQ